MIDLDTSAFAGVQRWVERIEARPAVQAGVTVGAMMAPEAMKPIFAGARARIDAMENSDKY